MDVYLQEAVLMYDWCATVSLWQVDYLRSVLLSRPVPGEPAQLRCKCSGSNQVRLGETFTSDIQVSVRDSTGNEIKKVRSVQM